MPDDELEDSRPPSWRKFDDIIKGTEMLNLRVETIERAFDRHSEEHAAIRDDIRSMGAEIRKLIEMVASMKEIQKNHDGELKKLWGWPVKILSFIGLFGVAFMYFWKFIKWAVAAGDIPRLR